MKDIDELINETLSKEDEELLADYGREPGYFKQAMALFRGKLGWVMWLVGIIQLLFFVAAVYALYQVLCRHRSDQHAALGHRHGRTGPAFDLPERLHGHAL
jgi:hypothetical protein